VTGRRRAKVTAAVVAWTLAVYFIGPVITALARAAAFRASLARMDDDARAHARNVIADRLLDLYDARNPPPQVLYQIERDYCGYDLPSNQEDLKGLDYLWEAMLRSDADAQRRIRLQRFGSMLSDFSFSFLGSCISSTILAHQCETYVGHVLDRNGIKGMRDMPTDPNEQRVQDGVTCRYLDGVAARAGRPLVGAQSREPGQGH